MSGHLEIPGHDGGVSQCGYDITPAQYRAAASVLAAQALTAAGGDWDTARDMLRDPLEAIGMVPYDAASRGPYGRRAPRREETP